MSIRFSDGDKLPDDLLAETERLYRRAVTELDRVFVGPVPVLPIFLDLPLLTGDEIAHAPHIAIGATPWPGSVAVWSSAEDAGYELNRLVAAPAIIGITESPLKSAKTGVWDRGTPLRVKITGGTLNSASKLSVLNGSNAVAIGDGSSEYWEVFQFSEAQLVAPDTYELSLRLRGQQGTDGIVPLEWPIGSTIVLLDLALSQIDLALSSRGLARYYRIGVTARGYDDPNVTLKVEAFNGIGLRPYPVSHLRVASNVSGDILAEWKRRPRIEGDNWQVVEVPLGEDYESYTVRIVQAAEIRAEYRVSTPQFTYSVALQAQDLTSGPYQIEIAQISSRFGPGPFRKIDLGT